MEQNKTFPLWPEWMKCLKENVIPSAVRDTVIRSVVMPEFQGEIRNVLLSMELGLMTTEIGGVMKVTREGTAIIEMYLRYLESRIAFMEGLVLETDEQVDGVVTEMPCKTCDGSRYLTEKIQGKKGKLYKKCPVCKGIGFNLVKLPKEK